MSSSDGGIDGSSIDRPAGVPFSSTVAARTILRGGPRGWTPTGGTTERKARGTAVSERRRTGRGSAWPSLVFGVLAIVLAVTAVLLYVGREEAEPVPTPPPALPGQNEMIHVANALRQQELNVAFAPGGIPPGELSVPGQLLTVDGARLYVFVYADAGRAEAEAARADPSAILPERSPSGTPIATGPPHLASHSNVTVALVGGSPEVAEKVDRAIEGLP